MNSSALVFCEGKEDRLVFEKLAALEGLEDVSFEDYGGKNNLVNQLKALQKRKDFAQNQIRVIAITRDADDSHDTAWQSLCGSAQSAFGVSLTVPGQIVSMPGRHPKDPAIGVTGWVLPGNRQPGMLESLCLESVSGQPAYHCLAEYVSCLEKTTDAALHPKAMFHAWVVSHTDFKDKDYNIATAVKEDRFAWSDSAFDELRAFLKSLKNP